MCLRADCGWWYCPFIFIKLQGDGYALDAPSAIVVKRVRKTQQHTNGRMSATVAMVNVGFFTHYVKHVISMLPFCYLHFFFANNLHPKPVPHYDKFWHIIVRKWTSGLFCPICLDIFLDGAETLTCKLCARQVHRGLFFNLVIFFPLTLQYFTHMYGPYVEIEE